MQKKNIISLSGDLAAGKSIVANILKDKLNFSIYKNGEYFRKLAKEMNMDLSTFGNYVAIHPEIDKNIEESAKEYALNHDNFILEARLGFYVVPESFKVYLKVDINEASKRAFLDKNRKDLENFNSIEEHKKALIERYNKENQRYINLYGIDKSDMNNYDLVIDTTKKTPEEVSNIIISEFERWKNI